jgi:hypothetical protein
MYNTEDTPQSRYSGVSHNDADAYNYDRFHPRTLAKDIKLIQHPEGPYLDEKAPDFVLRDTDGKEWRLSDLEGRPVVLIIGSGTCPLTQGNLPGLQDLYQDYQDRCTWLMLYVREAHPGEHMQGHRACYELRLKMAVVLASMMQTKAT